MSTILREFSYRHPRIKPTKFFNLTLQESAQHRLHGLATVKRKIGNSVHLKDYDVLHQSKSYAFTQMLPKKIYRSMSKQQGTVESSISASSYQTYASTLAQKSHSTLLYTAPSSLAYYISSYTASTFCFSYGILSYWNNYIYAPPDIAVWVPYSFAGVSFAMVLFGIRFLRNPVRIVRQITALPKIVNSKPTLEIKVELKKMFPLPFFPPRIFSVPPQEIIIPTPVSRPITPHMTTSDLRRQKAEKALRQQQELEYERSHIMSAGLRHMGRAISKLCTGAFRAVQRSFTRENFMEMRIRGKIYKLDLDGGWVLDKGRAIDRLVTLEPYSNSRLSGRL